MAGETQVLIGGVDVTARLAQHPSIDFAINRRGLARLSFSDRIGIWRPTLFDEVVIRIEGVPVFGGAILTARGAELRQIGTAPYASGAVTGADVPDFAMLADRALFNGPTLAGPLRDALAPVVARLTAEFGVTFGASAPGPLVPALAFSFRVVREPFDQLTQLAGWTWTISPGKVFTLAPGGAAPAPRALDTANGRIVAFEWAHTQGKYRNVQWVQFGESGIRPWTHSETSDGARTVYPFLGLGYTGELRPVSTPGTIRVGAADLPVGPVGDLGVDWWFRNEPNAVQFELRPGAAIPAAGVVITWSADAQFPGALVRGSGSGPHAEAIDTITTTDDPAAAAAFADALLAQYAITPRTAQCETRWLDFRPGQAVSVNLPGWGFVASCLIESVQLRHVLQRQGGQHMWVARLSLVEGDLTQGSWLDFWRNALTVGSGSGTSFTGAGTGGGGGGGGGGGLSPIYAGGTRALALTDAAAWTRIPGFVDVLIYPSVGSLTLRCQAWVRQAGASITVRVVSLESPAVIVGTGSATSATDETAPAAFQEIPITVRPLPAYYRVEALVTPATAEGFVAGCVLYPPAV